MQAQIYVETEAEDFKSTVLSENFVALLTHMPLPAQAFWAMLVWILAFLGFNKAFSIELSILAVAAAVSYS